MTNNDNLLGVPGQTSIALIVNRDGLESHYQEAGLEGWMSSEEDLLYPTPAS
jgi:hypothetical protein